MEKVIRRYKYIGRVDTLIRNDKGKKVPVKVGEIVESSLDPAFMRSARFEELKMQDNIKAKKVSDVSESDENSESKKGDKKTSNGKSSK